MQVANKDKLPENDIQIIIHDDVWLVLVLLF